MKRKMLFTAIGIAVVATAVIIILTIGKTKDFVLYTGMREGASPVELFGGTLIYEVNVSEHTTTGEEQRYIGYYRNYFDGTEPVEIGRIYNFVASIAKPQTIVDNVLYFYAGVENEKGELDSNLYGIDLQTNSMSLIKTDEGISPIVPICTYGEKLLAMKTILEGDIGYTFLELYNPQTGDTEIVDLNIMDTANRAGSVIIMLFVNENKTYVFVDEYDESGDPISIIEVYDSDFQCIQTISLNEVSDYINESRPNEMAVFGDYVYLRNQSIYSLVGKIENDTVKPILQARDLELAINRSNNGQLLNTQVFYVRKTNIYYLLDLEKDTLKEKTYDSPFDGHTLLFAMANSDNIIIYSWIHELDENKIYTEEEFKAARDERYILCDIDALN